MNKNTKIHLRKYQQKTKTDIIDLFNKGQYLVIDGTFMGGGKTITISEITKYYSEQNKKVIILLTMIELISQLEEMFRIYNINYEVIHRKRKIKNINSNVWIIMEQSYNQQKHDKLKLKCDVLIKDEFHIGYMADTGKRYKQMIKFFKPKHILGLSGTPYDKEGYLLKNVNKKNLLLHGNVKELTKNGFLVPLKYYTTKWSEEISYTNIKIVNKDYSIKELDRKLNNLKYFSLVLDAMEQLNAKNKKVLIYVTTIEHAENFNNFLKKHNYKTAVIHSNQKNYLNKTYIDEFNNSNNINCLVSIGKLTTGFNSPIANLLVNCRPTKILSLYLQIIFRIARPYKNKKYGEILDLAQGISEHGFGNEFRNIVNKKIINNSKKKIIKKIIKKIDNSKKIISIDINNINKTLKEIKKEEILNYNKENFYNLIKEFNNSNNKNDLINLTLELIKRTKNIKINNNNSNNIKKLLNYYYNELKKNNNNNTELIIQFKEKLKDFISNFKN